MRAIPFISVCDAYWSPERPFNPPLPVFGYTRFVPIALAKSIFRLVSPLAFRLHARPLERLRAKFGLASLGYDLRRSYTDADLRLFANFPALFADVRVHSGADFIGPIAWSPDFSGNLDFLAGEGPLTYVTMGSSGDPQVIAKIVPILEHLGSRVVITTAGKPLSFVPKHPSTQVFDYLPGATVCQHASLVICNGGSPSTNQALGCGVPVLGIARNMDQFLNMEPIVAFGAGQLIRADRSAPSCLRSVIERLMNDQTFSVRARELAGSLPPEDSSTIFARHIVSLHATTQAASRQADC